MSAKAEFVEKFGTLGKYPFNLENRYWMRLMERLATLQVVKDEIDDEVYHFLSEDEDTYSFRVAPRADNEGTYTQIELLRKDMSIALEYRLYPIPVGLDSDTTAHHPLSELLELIKPQIQEGDSMKRVRILASVLDC